MSNHLIFDNWIIRDTKEKGLTQKVLAFLAYL